MKLLLDQNLSHRLVTRLSVHFPDSKHVRELGMEEAPDSVIWRYAAEEGYTIISKDVDFQQRTLLLGHPPKVVWLRIGNAPTWAVEQLLIMRLPELLAFEADPDASFLVV